MANIYANWLIGEHDIKVFLHISQSLFPEQIYVEHTKKVPAIDVWKKTIKALCIVVHSYIEI